ncbi:MAG: VanY protein [Patescibacteria group bacterium]|nr:VanY protein [Patescibacteria group bacterium]
MSFKNSEAWFWVAVVLLAGVLTLGGVVYWLWAGTAVVNSDLASTTLALKLRNDELTKLHNENADLSQDLHKEKNKNNEFEEQIEDITDTVGTLEKWSQTDPELLQKYSKVIFLNENYIPSELADIPENYLYDQNKKLSIHAEIKDRLLDMVDDAKDDGVDIKLVSAYRSFGAQSSLKNSYAVTYGAGTANQFSADQGYSEHQLGTTIDFTTSEISAIFTGFEQTKAYKWLAENGYKYGFIMSYPKGNTYYQYEPWHWRFVGKDLARDLHKSGKNFYDLDQRELDKYLVEFFD